MTVYCIRGNPVTSDETLMHKMPVRPSRDWCQKAFSHITVIPWPVLTKQRLLDALDCSSSWSAFSVSSLHCRRPLSSYKHGSFSGNTSETKVQSVWAPFVLLLQFECARRVNEAGWMRWFERVPAPVESWPNNLFWYKHIHVLHILHLQHSCCESVLTAAFTSVTTHQTL